MKKNRAYLELECAIVDFNAKYHPSVQALRIAMFDSLKLHYMYSKVLERFPNLEPFASLKFAEMENLQSFYRLFNRYEIKALKSDCMYDVIISNEPLECLELAVAMQIKSVQVYEKIMVHVQRGEALDLCYKIQAMHYEEHLPLLRSAVGDCEVVKSFDPEVLMQKMGEYQQIVQNLQDSNMNQEQMMGMLGKMNFSMISGVVAGGAMVALLNQTLNKNEE